MTDIKMKVEMPVVTHQDCKKKYPTLSETQVRYFYYLEKCEKKNHATPDRICLGIKNTQMLLDCIIRFYPANKFSVGW